MGRTAPGETTECVGTPPPSWCQDTSQLAFQASVVGQPLILGAEKLRHSLLWVPEPGWEPVYFLIHSADVCYVLTSLGSPESVARNTEMRRAGFLLCGGQSGGGHTTETESQHSAMRLKGEPRALESWGDTRRTLPRRAMPARRPAGSIRVRQGECEPPRLPGNPEQSNRAGAQAWEER